MSTLTSASSFDDVLDSYLNNASYEEDASATKAAAFVTACRMLLVMMAKRTTTGSRASVEMDVEQIKQELQRAREWLATHPASTSTLSRGGARSFDLSGMYD